MKQKCDDDALGDGLLFLRVFVAEGVAAEVEAGAVRVAAAREGEGEAEGEAEADDPPGEVPAAEV